MYINGKKCAGLTKELPKFGEGNVKKLQAISF